MSPSSRISPDSRWSGAYITLTPRRDELDLTSHVSSLDEDIVGLLCKRVFDLAGCCNGYAGSRLQVHLNGKKLAIKSFQQYVGMYEGLEPPAAFEKVNERWEIGVGPSDGQFTQISFVNSICTVKGGQHANHVADKVIQKLAKIVKKKNKGEDVKPHFIKNHLAVYVNCLIENPAFDSQTKESLTTRPAAFGSDVVSLPCLRHVSISPLSPDPIRQVLQDNREEWYRRPRALVGKIQANRAAQAKGGFFR